MVNSSENSDIFLKVTELKMANGRKLKLGFSDSRTTIFN